MNDTGAAAYGGPGWQPRTTRLEQEIGSLWSGYAVDNEWRRLEAVLLHRPGAEIAAATDPDAALMLEIPDPALLVRQHDVLAGAYRSEGVDVHYVEPAVMPPPNQLFAADTFFMTPSGAVVGRPASRVRAGEERWVARRLADLGVPILRSVGGGGTFEGADAMWLDDETVVIGRGLRTNDEGARQVSATLHDLGVASIIADLPHAAMHLMGLLRIVDANLAFIRGGALPWVVVEALRCRGFDVRLFPSEDEMATGMAHNFVTLGPRRILMPAGCPVSEAAFREAGVATVAVAVEEITKAAGAIGCLSGVLSRERAT